ncbi:MULTISPECIES: ATP-grasp domain-containing protein [Rhizobium/Agrobacterium group]|uniref:D-alanine--D-alanine ligase family protein n=1 Tax=Rhizobium/Agrobacterium group TaxID=227290 RepID=UPI000FDB9771|nr:MULTISPECIES: ATP-grasp domain-containing protein [Rhizobium/Agrobacterium group]RVT69306.1 ATP-grasp domain-containing protein [Agrobacterium sp. CNPSo 2736]WHO77274.1 ATP-grasp domain-containing protein [Rhizobium sp. BT03]
MRVAVVRNKDVTGVINRFGQAYPQPAEPYAWPQDSSDGVVAALQEGGHEVLLCEGDKGLLATLERFMPPDSQARPSGIVFNLAAGIQGEARYTHVPAILEMAGIPYTGSSPLGHALAQDKVIAKRLIRAHGVPTPNFRVMHYDTVDTGDLRFPVVVKPPREDDSLGLQLVREPDELKRAVEAIVKQYAQEALVEEYVDGREISVPLLGNGDLEVLPLVEHDFGDRPTRLMTWEAKYVAAAAPSKICPAQIESRLATVLRDISITTFRACQCRDYARVDFRIDRSGQPFVLEINANPSLATDSSYFVAAETIGHSLVSLVNRILDTAHTRYFGTTIL